MFKDHVLATVADRIITEEDLDLLIHSLDPKTAAHFKSDQGKRELVEEMVNQELLYLDAIDSGIENEKEYRSQIERLKMNFLKQYATYKLLEGIKVESQEILDYYNQNKSQFINPQSVRASHILVDDSNKAREIISEINQGLSFEDAAKKYSKCPSKAQGGDLGYFTRGRMVPEFEQAAFEMKKDEVSEPIQTQFGYHIIKVLDKKEEKPMLFDEVKDQLEQQLLSSKQQDIYAKKINELKGKYEVKINV